MHPYNQTSLLCFPTLLHTWTARAALLRTQIAWMLPPCWKAGRQPQGPMRDYVLLDPHTLHSSNISAAVSRAFDGAMQRSRASQSGKRRPVSPASTTAMMMWRYTDVYQSDAERGHSGNTAQSCSKWRGLWHNYLKTNLWKEAESWQRSKYLSQVPLSARWTFSSKATDYV